jgi:ATP-dependent Clp protease adapter protein ClpS
MTTRAFKYYLHDSYSTAEFAEVVLEDQLGLSEDEAEALAEKAARPFYEVAFDCTIDTVTGKVTFQLAEGQGT